MDLYIQERGEVTGGLADDVSNILMTSSIGQFYDFLKA